MTNLFHDCYFLLNLGEDGLVGPYGSPVQLRLVDNLHCKRLSCIFIDDLLDFREVALAYLAQYNILVDLLLTPSFLADTGTS